MYVLVYFYTPARNMFQPRVYYIVCVLLMNVVVCMCAFLDLIAWQCNERNSIQPSRSVRSASSRARARLPQTRDMHCGAHLKSIHDQRNVRFQSMPHTYNGMCVCACTTARSLSIHRTGARLLYNYVRAARCYAQRSTHIHSRIAACCCSSRRVS